MITPLGTEEDLGPGHIVLGVVPSPRERGTAAPSFRLMSIVAMVAHLSYCRALVQPAFRSRVLTADTRYTEATVRQTDRPNAICNGTS